MSPSMEGWSPFMGMSLAAGWRGRGWGGGGSEDGRKVRQSEG